MNIFRPRFIYKGGFDIHFNLALKSLIIIFRKPVEEMVAINKFYAGHVAIQRPNGRIPCGYQLTFKGWMPLEEGGLYYKWNGKRGR